MIINIILGIILIIQIVLVILHLITRKAMKLLRKDFLSLYENQDKQKIAAMQLFAGIGQLMDQLAKKNKKFSWTKKDSEVVIKTMELERNRVIGAHPINDEGLKMRKDIVNG